MSVFISNDERMNGMSKGDAKILLKLVASKLQDGEVIESAIASGVKRVNYGLKTIPYAFVIATNKRVLFFKQLSAFKSDLKSFPYEQIKSIEIESGVVFSELSFYGTNNEFSIEKVSTPIANNFIELVENNR